VVLLLCSGTRINYHRNELGAKSEWFGAKTPQWPGHENEWAGAKPQWAGRKYVNGLGQKQKGHENEKQSIQSISKL